MSGNETTTVSRAADMIQYQTGAVVSRVIIKSASGTVTLFAFDEGQELSEHKTPFEALVHLLDGEAEIIIDGAAHQLAAGDIIIMPADHPHAVKAVKRFKMMLTMIKEPREK
jgi:quercetin dioxygenase-like cupin family protein